MAYHAMSFHLHSSIWQGNPVLASGRVPRLGLLVENILSFGLLERNILISCWHFTSDTQVLDKYLRPGGCGRPHGKEPSRCTQTHSLSVPEQTTHVSLHEFLVGNLHVWHRGQHNAEQVGQARPRRLEVGEDPAGALRGGQGGGWRCTGSGS